MSRPLALPNLPVDVPVACPAVKRDGSDIATALNAAIVRFDNANPLKRDPCPAETQTLNQRATASGTALRALVPYRSRTLDQVSAMLTSR